MNGIARRVAVAVATVTLCLGVVGAPTAGATGPGSRSTAGLHPRLGAMAPTAATVPTTNYGAGYFTYPGDANGLASVSARFTVSPITCQRADDNEWLLPGIWVYSAGSLTEQVDVNANCSSGPGYEGDVICVGPTCDQSLAVAPGDTIEVSLAYTPSATIGTVKDVTQHTSAQVVGPVITTDDTVFVGDEGPSLFGVARVPTFTNVPFSAVRVNGQDLVDSPFPTRYNLKTNKAVQIKTGAIRNDANFATTFAHN